MSGFSRFQTCGRKEAPFSPPWTWGPAGGGAQSTRTQLCAWALSGWGTRPRSHGACTLGGRPGAGPVSRPIPLLPAVGSVPSQGRVLVPHRETSPLADPPLTALPPLPAAALGLRWSELSWLLGSLGRSRTQWLFEVSCSVTFMTSARSFCRYPSWRPCRSPKSRLRGCRQFAGSSDARPDAEGILVAAATRRPVHVTRVWALQTDVHPE